MSEEYKQMKKLNPLRTGVVLSYINLLIGNLIPFFYTPIMLRILGQEEYGLYTIANSVVSYLSLLNFGIGSSIIRYIAKYRAEGDREGERRLLGLFVTIYSIIGILIIIVGTTLAFNIEIFYGNTLSVEEVNTLRILIILLSISMGVVMPLNVFASLIMAHEEYILSGIVRIASSLLSPILNLAVLFLGWRSIGLVASSSVLSIGVNVIYCIYAISRLKLIPIFKGWSGKLLKEILYYSFFHFLASIVDMLYWNTDKILLGAMVGTVAVAVYNIGAMFHTYTQSIATSISSVLMPRVTKMFVDHADSSAYTELFIRVGRLQYLIVGFIVSAFCVFGQQFILLWSGPGYEESYWVAILVLLPSVVPWIQNLGLQILTAQNMHRFRSVVYLFIALLNVVLTYLWIKTNGIIGAAAASGVAYIIGQGFIMNWYYWKKIGIDIPKFWKVIGKMLCYTIAISVFWFVITHTIFTISNIWRFLAGAVLYTITYLIVAYVFMMNDYEKDFVKKPLLTIRNGIIRK